MLDGFSLKPLAAHHQRERFESESNSLNEFIHRYARKQHQNDTTRVHVFADGSGVIAGFFTLSALTLELTSLPEPLMRGRPRLAVPSTLLGRLAVDQGYGRRGLGRFILSLALREALAASKIVASAFVVLDVAADASAGARNLYLRAGFEPLPSNAARLILPIAAIERHA